MRSKITRADNHFDNGGYEYNKIVLGWNPEEVKLKDELDYYYASELVEIYECKTQYYNAFKPLILKETQAMLSQGMEKLPPASKLTVLETRLPRKETNPAIINLKGALKSKQKEGGSGLVLLIKYKHHEFFGLTSIKNWKSNKLRIKVILREDLYEKVAGGEDLQGADPSHNRSADYLFAYVINSVITLRRMYEVCVMEPDVSFMRSLIANDLTLKSDPHPFSYRMNSISAYASTRRRHEIPIQNKSIEGLSDKCAALIESKLIDLNDSQREAVRKIESKSEGICLIQGPPGTGKTTTIVSFLLHQVKHHKENITLVSGPSNKSVQVLLRRFKEKARDMDKLRVLLIGTEQKLPDDLRENFLHTWAPDTLDDLKLVSKALSNFKEALDEINLTNLSEVNAVKVSQTLRAFYQAFFETASELIPRVQEKFIHMNVKRLSIHLELVSFMNSYNQTHPYIQGILETKPRNKKDEDFLRLIKSNKRELCERRLAELSKKVEKIINILENTDIEAFLMKQAHIIFSTLSVTGRQQVREHLKIHTLIVDEAAQSVEAETLIPLGLGGLKRLILVGDTNQLPATVTSQLAKQLGYDISMMQRLEIHNPSHLLSCQYRMHPEISAWPARKYYNDLLDNGSNVFDREPVLIDPNDPHNPLLRPTSFIHIPGKERQGKYSHSLENEVEVQVIRDLIFYLQQYLGFKKDIGVITFYASQSKALKKRLSGIKGVRVSTVDGFQGDENTIIIISCVRANEHNTVGFVSDFRRLNVAITRAKYHLYILGHQKTLQKSNTAIAKLIRNYQERELILEYKALANIISRSKEAPTNRVCTFFKQGKIASCKQGLYCNNLHSAAKFQISQVHERAQYEKEEQDPIIQNLSQSTDPSASRWKKKIKPPQVNHSPITTREIVKNTKPQSRWQKKPTTPEISEVKKKVKQLKTHKKRGLSQPNPEMEKLISCLSDNRSVKPFRKAAKALDNINARHIGKVGDTVLMKLVRKNTLQSDRAQHKLSILVDLGADWHAENNKGQTAFGLLKEKHPDKVDKYTERFNILLPPAIADSGEPLSPAHSLSASISGERIQPSFFAQSATGINRQQVGERGCTTLGNL